MWNMLVIAAMVSITGFYSMFDKSNPALTEAKRSMPYAESMAVYRNTVIDFYAANPNTLGSVIPANVLQPLLPQWLTIGMNGSAPTWANYRDTDGTIYIYASVPPPVNITRDIIEMSHYSIFAGEYRTGDTTLFSPLSGNTRIILPPRNRLPIPPGSPVWIAMSK